MRTLYSLHEARVRQLIREELIRDALQEGIWDDVTAGAKKLKSAITKKFAGAAASWAETIAGKVDEFTTIPDNVKKIMQVLKVAMSESGESFELDDSLKAAKELGELGKKSLQIVDADFNGPVKELAKSLQKENKFYQVHSILTNESYIRRPKRLHEDFGVTTAVGLGLAVMGGLPMLFKGLHKLANALGAKNAAHMFEKAEHVTHAFEQKTIEFVMPNKLAYAIYKGLWKLGIKLTKGEEPLNELELKADPEGKAALVKAKSLAYKVLLIYFAFQGIAGVLKAGASMLGFVEGAATTIKGIELAKGAQELVKLST